MANVLKMDKKILIKQLLALGWSYRRIHRETGIHRDTVARYDPNHPARPEQSIQNRRKHALSLAEGCPPSPCKQKKPTRTSEAQAHDAVIREKVKQELSAQRIYQDLVVEYAYPHSYDSIKRYVRKLKAKTPKLFARIHTAAGEEAHPSLPRQTSTSPVQQSMGSVRYHTIALLCQEKTEFGTQLTLLQEHELIRSPQEYQLYTEDIDKTWENHQSFLKEEKPWNNCNINSNQSAFLPWQKPCR